MHDVRLHAVDEGADDGHAAHAAGFKVQPRVGAAGDLFQFVPVFAEQLFIGSDDRFAAVQRRQHEALGGFDAADDFHDDIDVRIADHLGDVGGNFALFDAEGERALAVDLEHALDGNIYVLRAAVEIAVLGQNFVSAAADNAQAEYCHADGLHSGDPPVTKVLEKR